MAQMPAGWYDDGTGVQRYWDGTAWTAHTAPAAGGAAPGPRAAAGRGGGRGPLIAILVALGILLVAGAVVAVLFVTGVLGGGAPPTATTPVETTEPTETETTPTPAPTEEAAALAEQAVLAYDRAWLDLDCDAFFAVTTEIARADLGLETCEAFIEFAQTSAATNYETVITNVKVDEATLIAFISTEESFDGTDGRQTDYVQYTVRPRDGVYLVDGVLFLDE